MIGKKMDLFGEVEEGEREGVFTLTGDTTEIDLLTLQGGVNETLGTETVPEGEYAQIRFLLSSEQGANFIELDDGSTQNLEVPSGQQTGIKIVLPGEVEVENDGDQLEVTLDFDVDDSLIEQGSGEYRFKPTIRIKEVFVNGESIETVSVGGLVTGVDAGSNLLGVESVSFEATGRTEFEGDGAASVGDFSEGQFVEAEGKAGSDGSIEALKLEADDEDDGRSMTGRLEAKNETEGEESITLLGVPLQVTSDTEYGDASLSELEVGDRIDVDFVENENGERVATEIEREND